MLPSQMMKGILDNCILIVIAQEDTYGYDISQKLKSYGFSDISEGTIYPLHLRLEKNGCINSEFRKSAYGPNRKYYTITKAGHLEIQDFMKHWKELQQGVAAVMGGYAYES